MKVLHIIAFILLVVGGLNWGLYGLAGIDLVSYLGPVSTAVYALVGLAAVYSIFTHKSMCKGCDSKTSQSK